MTYTTYQSTSFSRNTSSLTIPTTTSSTLPPSLLDTPVSQSVPVKGMARPGPGGGAGAGAGGGGVDGEPGLVGGVGLDGGQGFTSVPNSPQNGFVMPKVCFCVLCIYLGREGGRGGGREGGEGGREGGRDGGRERGGGGEGGRERRRVGGRRRERGTKGGREREGGREGLRKGGIKVEGKRRRAGRKREGISGRE